MAMVSLGRDRNVADAPAKPAGVFLPDRFIDAVAGHVLHNDLHPDIAPLMLAVIGPPGTGKSWQVREVARRHAWHVEELHASSLAGAQEGVVVRRLHDAYGRAADRLTDFAQSFVLLDDFDQCLVSIRSNVETSQHTQLLTSAFMELCDRPAGIRTIHPERIPLIVTTNTLDAVHAPLIRYGRMHVFHWAPTATELAAILEWMLAGISPSVRRAVSRRFASHGLAFFKELKSEVLKDLIMKRIRQEAFGTQGLDVRDIEVEFESTPFERFESVGLRIIAARAKLNCLGS
jgi:AAA+ superfamily predicted ATPase